MRHVLSVHFDNCPPFFVVITFLYDGQPVELVGLVCQMQQPVSCDVCALAGFVADEYNVFE